MVTSVYSKRVAVFSVMCLLAGPTFGISSGEQLASDLEMVNLDALQRAVEDLDKDYGQQYPNGSAYLDDIRKWQGGIERIRAGVKAGDTKAMEDARAIIQLHREALLSNPLMDFDKLLLIKRRPKGDPRRPGDPDRGLGEYIGLPRQSSWQLPKMNNRDEWDNEICVLSPVRTDGGLSTVYKPDKTMLVTDMDLGFDGDKLMFSMPDDKKMWQIYEISTDGSGLRQVSQTDHPDIHNFDSCYLTDGRIAFISTATFQGVPCNSGIMVGMTYLMDADGGNIRQLCFEQDHNFCPTVMNDGRILYLRWEYTDIPHVWARFLFTMNPDGTGQREYYGSGGYWPNAIFYARPVPDHPTKVVSIVTGHHVGRVGELVVFDPALGRQSTSGVVTRVGSYGKEVDPIIMDKLAIDSWPLFLHPWPLSQKYFLAAAKPRPNDLWGIYLVDVFDNMLLLKEIEDHALLEPIPLRATRKPPVIIDRVDPERKDAVMYIEDVHMGPGLKDVPRGTVKKLRLFTYHFAYRKIAGIDHRVGADGPWEPKRVLGTVPVEEDGSAIFSVPANTPISIQPIDEQGQALQLMRSWTTAMPGEFVSCVGCHDKQNSTPSSRRTIASLKLPSEIEPWYGPVRGFSFAREVQPVLDKYCVSCHDGSAGDTGAMDLRGNQGRFIAYKNGKPEAKVFEGVPREELVKKYGGVFDPSYITLRSYVRVGGLESDLRLLEPAEFGVETCELVQILQKGHYGVELDNEAWERIFAWIDLNAPAHGTWKEVVGVEKTSNDCRRRADLQRAYANIDENPEVIAAVQRPRIEPVLPKPVEPRNIAVPEVSSWPFDPVEAATRQRTVPMTGRSIDLGGGVRMSMVLVPAGEFVMGDPDGHDDELPLTIVRIDKPFWMGRVEVTNEQYAQFDPSHDSRQQDKGSWMFNEWDLGWDLNRAGQPVVRINWQQAMAFCDWLSQKTGDRVSLPTEAQWEWACRAGTDSPMSYGDLDTDFSTFANMADYTMRDLVYDARNNYSPDLVPRDARFNDGLLVSAEVGSYRPNAWGLYDMHGNVWEWTLSGYMPYPYRDGDGRNDAESEARRVVRGGSWHDRPKRCRSAFRLSYPQWQRVYNVGFRVVMEVGDDLPVIARVSQD